MITSNRTLTTEEFLALPETDTTYEFVDNQAIAKMSPKFFHASIQLELAFLIAAWCKDKGRVRPEWAVRLKRNGKDWIPVPDLVYVSFAQLSEDWIADEPCPVPPTLAIEIISPGQSFGYLTGKAGDYLNADVKRVWIIDPKAKTLTIFYPDAAPETIKGAIPLEDEILPDLKFSPQELFERAGLN